MLTLIFGSKLGCNSAESEPIWMKSVALWVHCQGLVLADFVRDPRSSDSRRARRATHDFTDFPSARFHEIWTQDVDQCRNENFRNRTL